MFPGNNRIPTGTERWLRRAGFAQRCIRCRPGQNVPMQTGDNFLRCKVFGGVQEGERVTFVTCPEAASTLRKQGFLTSRPPGTKPGEPLVAVNHVLGTRTPLLRPPSKAASALPQWLPVVLGGFVATELGSGFFDPNLPALIAGGLAVAGTSYVSGSQLLIPRLKQLPESSVRSCSAVP